MFTISSDGVAAVVVRCFHLIFSQKFIKAGERERENERECERERERERKRERESMKERDCLSGQSALCRARPLS